MVHPTTKFKKKKGSREDVWKGIAQETAGGLKKKDLMISKTGNIVSKKASKSASERMKSGDGLCGYCIKQYKLGKIKNSSDKKSTKKSNKKSTKKSNKKSTKKDERKLKEKKPKGASEKKINELQKEIDSLRSKAGRITEREGKITKEVKKILENITKKAREKILMKKFLKNKEKKKLR
jgi:hypothetical protein